MLYEVITLAAAVAPPLAKRREGVVDARDGPARLLAGTPRREPQMLVDAERGPDAAALRHVGDAVADDAVGREAEDLLAARADAAAGGGGEPHA